MKSGPLMILGIVLAFILLHISGPMPEGGSRALAATTIGGSAYILMAVTIFLSTRPGFLETAFGGLDRVYQAHKVSGVLATLLVLVHFIAAPKELPAGIDPALHNLVPSAPMGMVALILLVISLALTLNRKIAYHRWRLVHKAMGLVFMLITAHFVFLPEVFMPKSGLSGLILIGAAILGISGALANWLGLSRRKSHAFSISEITHFDRATEVVLTPDGTMFDYCPGQFAILEMADKTFNEPHPFTIASAPGNNELRFSMKVLGDWTRQVREELAPGGKVKVHGPYGRFDASKAGPKQVWLAGGIGITPFLSKIRAMKSDDARDIVLVYAVREIDEAVYWDELQARAAELPNLKLVLLQSNLGEFAKVEKMHENLEGSLAEYEFFMCGPKPMITGLSKDLKAANVPAGNIHTEAFEFR